MAKLNHKQKVKLARKLRTPAELSSGVGLFHSLRWRIRKSQIRFRVAKQQYVSHQMAEARRAQRQAEAEAK